MWRTTCRGKQSGISSCKSDTQALATGGWSHARCRSRCNTPEKYRLRTTFVVTNHYLNTLKSLVNISSPEVKAIKDGAILMCEESCQLQHPLPPLTSVYPHPLATFNSQPTKGVVGWQGDHQLHAALVDAVGGYHLSHRVTHPQTHIF